MPLPTPILDDRSYQQLRDELVARIPVYAPEWTDHNASDPGVTLLELFAFLGEHLLFRFNQIPEATRLEFLRLLQIPLRPARPANALVAFKLTAKNPEGVLVPMATGLKAGAVPFETVDEVHVWPLTALGVVRLATDPPTSQEGIESVRAAIQARGGLAPDEEPAHYLVTRVPPDPSAPDAVSVDLHRSVDGMLWIAVLRTKDTDVAKLGDAIVNVGFVPDERVYPTDEIVPCPGDGTAPSGPEVIWQISTAEVDPTTGTPTYQAIAVEGDTTLGLSQQGVVRLRLPREAKSFGTVTLADDDLAGTGDLPPPLDDDDLSKDVLFWLRVFRRDRDRALGRVEWVGANVAAVTQMKTATSEFLGTGTGQVLVSKLTHGDVVDGTLTIEVEEADRWTPWTAVDGFQASREDDRHYVVDREAGLVHFGNGVRGRAPQLGERIRAVGYRYTAGDAGNVAVKAIAKVEGMAGLACENPQRARGGAAAETIEEGLDRVPGELRRRDRAVTAGDFRELALMTPGATVGRAECLPLFHPPTHTRPAAGVVTVVVWPREDREHPNAPMPDRTLLRTVCAWLDSRRLVTTELYVEPPTYRRVAVAVGLRAKAGYGIEAVCRWVELVLRQYLAPLPPYGPSGQGWPLGRRVHGPELEAAALQVEGVEYLEGLRVAGWDGQGWVEGTVVLETYEVAELAEITVVDGPPDEPAKAVGPPVPPRTPVPIRKQPEEC
jgi:hypothetical protein